MLATSIQTRLNWPLGFWITVAAILVVAFILRNQISLIAFILTFTHLIHMVIVSLFDLPVIRYVWDTEFFILIAIFLLIFGLWDRITYHHPGTGAIYG